MNRTRLEFSTLKQRIEGSSAQLRVLIVDACRSGEITRVKGASPAEPFKIDPVGRGVGEGVAIITSAASDEDAQESDRLQASFFTHHLLSGMLGAADTSKDKQVTLGEAYGYAYNETLRSTSRAKVVQHPTYWFEIRGRQDLVLTSLLGGSSCWTGGAMWCSEARERGPWRRSFTPSGIRRSRWKKGPIW
jgi:hypothetical protein